jgi:hypothetical protein
VEYKARKKWWKQVWDRTVKRKCEMNQGKKEVKVEVTNRYGETKP